MDMNIDKNTVTACGAYPYDADGTLCRFGGRVFG